MTKAAVIEFQKNTWNPNGTPLVADGVMGCDTIAALLSPRFDAKPHTHLPEDVATYIGRPKILVFVGKPPSYMDRSVTCDEIKLACGKWAAAIGIPIELTETARSADIHIGWGYTELTEFTDGVGGELARATARAIEFDKASDSHLGLSRAPYVLYGVKYIDRRISTAPF